MPLLPVMAAGPGALSTEASASQSADDANEVTATGAVNITAIQTSMTNSSFTGIRFPNITIPQGATIISAFIQFTSSAIATEVSAINFWCEDADNAAAFAELAFNITARTRTTAVVEGWNPPFETWGSGNRTSEQKTPDLKTLVQEVVNRLLWVSGNALVVIATNTIGGDRRSASWDHTTLQEATLTVRYVA